jgi:hypothetical protein
MAWEGGADRVALTVPDLAMPNVIIHVARLVHTPLGSAPSFTSPMRPSRL